MRFHYTNEDPLQFALAGFEMRVLRRQFPDHQDYWDGNWLIVELEYRDKHSSVRANGPIVHLGEVAQLQKCMQSIYDCVSKSEKVDFMEPELGMRFEVGSRGDIRFELALTPKNTQQSHWYMIEIDLSYLSSAIAQCQAILMAYPIRDSERAS